MAILKAINETEMSHFKVNELLPTKQTKWLRSKVNFQSNSNKWIKQKKSKSLIMKCPSAIVIIGRCFSSLLTY